MQSFLILMLALVTALTSCSRARRDAAGESTPTRSADPLKPATSNSPHLDYRVAKPSPTEDVLKAAIDQIWYGANIYEDEATLKKTLAPATPGQRAIFAASWYEAEVNNGGHDQFFFNSTGILWEEALAGLALLGADAHRSLLERAVAQFPGHRPSKDRFQRQKQLEKVDSDVLDKLDDEFYALDSIELHMRRYIEAHPEEFFR